MGPKTVLSFELGRLSPITKMLLLGTDLRGSAA